MNPYEPPQSSLDPEPEIRPRVPVAYETYDALVMLKIIGVIFLVLIEISLGVILLQCLAIFFGLEPGGENGVLAAFFPFVAFSFLGNSWILWKLKQASDRKNS